MARRSKNRSRGTYRRSGRSYSPRKSRRSGVRRGGSRGAAVHIVVHQAGPQQLGEATPEMIASRLRANRRPSRAQF